MKRFGLRGVLLALALMSSLLMASVAGAAAGSAPASPIQVGFVNVSNLSLNGVSTTQLVVAPGANVTLTATVVSDHLPYCPSCIDNFPIGFAGSLEPAGCLVNQKFSPYTATNTVDLGSAPLTPGVYNIVGQAMLTYFCSQGWDPNGGTVIAQIVVAPTDADQCKDGGWQNFGGIFKNQGDCVSYVATHGTNLPSGN